jgi:hypothetical protein
MIRVALLERPRPVPSLSAPLSDDDRRASAVLSPSLKSVAGRKSPVKWLPPLVASRGLRSGPPSPTPLDTTKSAPMKVVKIAAAVGSVVKSGMFRPSATPGSKTDVSAFAALRDEGSVSSVEDVPITDTNFNPMPALPSGLPLALPQACLTVEEASSVFRAFCSVSEALLRVFEVIKHSTHRLQRSLAGADQMVFFEFIDAMIQLAIGNSTTEDVGVLQVVLSAELVRCLRSHWLPPKLCADYSH